MTEKQVVKYSVVEADIAQMRSIYMDLVITDLEDTEQFKQVKEARLIVKGKRCAVENERKAQKADALAWGKYVDSEAKKIFALIEPIETHLQNEEQKVIDEQNRIKREAEEAERKKNQARVDALLKVECVMPFLEVATLTDDEFDCLLTDKTNEFEERQKEKAEAAAAEQKRREEEAAARKAEEERLEHQRKEQEKKEAALKKQADELAKQKASARTLAITNLGFSFEDNIFYFDGLHDLYLNNVLDIPDNEFVGYIAGLEDMVNLARQEAKEKDEHEAKEAEELRIAEEKEKARQEALRPDKDKISEWLMNGEIQWLDKYPADVSEDAAQFVAVVRDELAVQFMEYRKALEDF